MPGFFESMKRMAQGKPLFDPNDQEPSFDRKPAEAAAPAPLHEEESLIQKGHDRTFPVVYVRQINVRDDGKRMQIYARIINTWPQEIELDKIRLLNTHHELDMALRPNEEREFLIYNGPRVTHEYREAFLDYKTHREDDYFEAIHDVGFFYNQNEKNYTVDEIKLRLPIRDILG